MLLVSNVNIAKEGLLVRVIAESEQMKEQQLQFDGYAKGGCPNTGRCIFNIEWKQIISFIKIENIEKNNRPDSF